MVAVYRSRWFSISLPCAYTTCYNIHNTKSNDRLVSILRKGLLRFVRYFGAFLLISTRNHACFCLFRTLRRVFSFETNSATRVFVFFQLCDACFCLFRTAGRVVEVVKRKGREGNRKGREQRSHPNGERGGGGRDLDEREKQHQSISLPKIIAMANQRIGEFSNAPTLNRKYIPCNLSHTHSLTHTHGIPKSLPTSILTQLRGYSRISS